MMTDFTVDGFVRMGLSHDEAVRANAAMREILLPDGGRGAPCPGEGKCHGPVKWCEHCGNVADVCDDPRCDAHAAYCEACGAYIGPGSLINAAPGRNDLCADCEERP